MNLWESLLVGSIGAMLGASGRLWVVSLQELQRERGYLWMLKIELRNHRDTLLNIEQENLTTAAWSRLQIPLATLNPYIVVAIMEYYEKVDLFNRRGLLSQEEWQLLRNQISRANKLLTIRLEKRLMMVHRRLRIVSLGLEKEDDQK